VGGVIAVASSTQSSHGPNLSGPVIARQVQQAVDALTKFIDDNTR
jgi:hypothetical protein